MVVCFVGVIPCHYTALEPRRLQPNDFVLKHFVINIFEAHMVITVYGIIF